MAEMICKICGKKFEGYGSACYCSDECRKKGHVKRQLGYIEKERRKHQREIAKVVLKTINKWSGDKGVSDEKMVDILLEKFKFKFN